MNWRAIAIDGPGGVGKSLLAKRLAEHSSAAVISMDSFLLPPDQYRIANYAKNYDLERFMLEVIEPLLAKSEIRYRSINLINGKLDIYRRQIPAHQKVIIEGIYSMEIGFRLAYDKTIFVDAPMPELLKRAVRPSEPSAKSWMDKWLDGEETYLKSQSPEFSADLVLDGSQPFPTPEQILSQLGN